MKWHLTLPHHQLLPPGNDLNSPQHTFNIPQLSESTSAVHCLRLLIIIYVCVGASRADLTYDSSLNQDRRSPGRRWEKKVYCLWFLRSNRGTFVMFYCNCFCLVAYRLRCEYSFFFPWKTFWNLTVDALVAALPQIESFLDQNCWFAWSFLCKVQETN